MKKYRNYTAKKFRLPRRIIFFAVVALLIVVFTVILGNVLKSRLENAEIDTSEVLTTTVPEENKIDNSDNGEVSRPHDEALAAVRAGYLDLSAEADGAAAVMALKSGGYNAVCFILTDEEGAITYASPAVEEASRLPASEALVSFEELSSAVNTAKSSGMRVSGVISASESYSDHLIISELSALGFEEFIIRGFEDVVTADNNAVERITDYVDELRISVAGDADMAVVFTAEFFSLPANAPYIEKLYNDMEFMAIDLSGADAEGAKSVATDLAGSFSAYLLRPLLSGEDTAAMKDVDAALTEVGIVARQYISIPEKKTADSNED